MQTINKNRELKQGLCDSGVNILNDVKSEYLNFVQENSSSKVSCNKIPMKKLGLLVACAIVSVVLVGCTTTQPSANVTSLVETEDTSTPIDTESEVKNETETPTSTETQTEAEQVAEPPTETEAQTETTIPEQTETRTIMEEEILEIFVDSYYEFMEFQFKLLDYYEADASEAHAVFKDNETQRRIRKEFIDYCISAEIYFSGQRDKLSELKNVREVPYGMLVWEFIYQCEVAVEKCIYDPTGYLTIQYISDANRIAYDVLDNYINDTQTLSDW